MRPINRFKTLTTDEGAGTCTLSLNGHALPEHFDGTILEGQYELPDGHSLICLSDESIYDAGLHLHLMTTDGRIEDVMEGGGFFCPGYFQARNLLDDSLDFRFFTNDLVYRVNVLPQSRFRFILPPGWRYKHRLRPHRLTLTEFAKAHHE